MSQDQQSDSDGVLSDEIRSGGARKPPSMRRVASASFVGTLIEFYDFGIYGFAAALVFGKVFFPALGPSAATVAAFATFGVAFVARPVGAIIFGHFGDRLGRKKTLILTLLIMGSSTILVGVMPTAGQVGVAAPILLVILRVIQGLAAGGEWAGAVLFSAESAPEGKRGFWSMFASLGAGVAVALAPATFLVAGLMMSDEAFLSFGWRLPFLASIVLLMVGLWIRLAMEETPVFKAEISSEGPAKIPFTEAFKRQTREIVLASGMMILTFCFGYLGVAYLTNYGTTIIGLPRTQVLTINVFGGVVYTVGILLSGIVSDRLGRRRVMIVASSVGVAWSLALFPILDIGTPFAFGVGVIVTMFIAGIALGPMSAFVSELFETRYRYTAVGLTYNVGGVIGGAVTPILAASITAAWGGPAFGYLLGGLALISLVCVLLLRETRGRRLDQHFADAAAG
jgi:MFS family permease